jgi:hypothetical protein
VPTSSFNDLLDKKAHSPVLEGKNLRRKILQGRLILCEVKAAVVASLGTHRISVCQWRCNGIVSGQTVVEK